MATLADSLVASSSRELRMRARPDLQANKQVYQGEACWVIKDPLALQYYRFQEEEYAILKLIDGKHSLDQIKESFESQFLPQRISTDELHHFIGNLHRSGLVISSLPGQGEELYLRKKERKKKELLSKFTNVLAIKFRGFDPKWCLDFLYPKTKFMFHPVGVFCSIFLMFAASILVLTQFEIFQSKLPAFHAFFTLENAFWFSIALGVSKIIHEFGHGLTCRHFKGECHEIGFLLLVLTPCLYCNVSDSWMIPSKWRRAMIGFAGIYIELVLASIATFVWWFSTPGLLNQLCLSIMFVSSVSTVIFNANPLLRYDGYYILADVLEIPNLRQKASDTLKSQFAYTCFGIEQQEDQFTPKRAKFLFISYTIASNVYRWFVTLSILLFLNEIFEPYGLKVVGQAIACMALFSLVGMPLWKLFKFLQTPGRVNKVSKKRTSITLGVVAVIIAFVFMVPFPYSVFCQFIVQPKGEARIFIEEPGVLSELKVKPGEFVQEGDVIAVLKNKELSVSITQLKNQLAEQQQKVEQLKLHSLIDSGISSQLPIEEKSLEDLKGVLEERMNDVKRLTLKAPRDGIVMVTRSMRSPLGREKKLPQMDGTPFDEKNKHCFLQLGTLFCLIGDPDQLEANVLVEQSDIELVAKDQDVIFQFDNLAGNRFHGKISQPHTDALEDVPQEMRAAVGGPIATKPNDQGVEKPLATYYQARMDLSHLSIDELGTQIRPSLRGRAKIYTRNFTLAQRFWRFATQTFHFQL